MAPLQKRALYGLIVCILWIIALVVTFISKGGIDTFVVDQGFEALMVGMVVVGFLAYGITLLVTRGKRGEVTMDERDRAILAKARATQLWSAMLTLACLDDFSQPNILGSRSGSRTIPIYHLYVYYSRYDSYRERRYPLRLLGNGT